MNCLPKNLKILYILLMALVSCQHQVALVDNSEPVLEAESQEVVSKTLPVYPETLVELERMESESPGDARLKLLIAKKQYCLKREDLAYENWYWVLRFSNEEELQKEAKDFIDDQSKRKAISCTQ